MSRASQGPRDRIVGGSRGKQAGKGPSFLLSFLLRFLSLHSLVSPLNFPSCRYGAHCARAHGFMNGNWPSTCRAPRRRCAMMICVYADSSLSPPTHPPFPRFLRARNFLVLTPPCELVRPWTCRLARAQSASRLWDPLSRSCRVIEGSGSASIDAFEAASCMYVTVFVFLV